MTVDISGLVQGFALALAVYVTFLMVTAGLLTFRRFTGL